MLTTVSSTGDMVLECFAGYINETQQTAVDDGTRHKMS